MMLGSTGSSDSTEWLCLGISWLKWDLSWDFQSLLCFLTLVFSSVLPTHLLILLLSSSNWIAYGAHRSSAWLFLPCPIVPLILQLSFNHRRFLCLPLVNIWRKLHGLPEWLSLHGCPLMGTGHHQVVCWVLSPPVLEEFPSCSSVFCHLLISYWAAWTGSTHTQSYSEQQLITPLTVWRDKCYYQREDPSFWRICMK